ncbi:hypothetical protein Van01_62700 [Micromonospora andamanensis]|uniref:Uncharacterized protein n=1 Tax=Micromonospora andamanensis TaxID=1287068 RepID=A0ABQ4I5I7_9ACTN|nr:hypothetical protein Van01_62700 [Micromonospora andamanensis]
MIVGVHKRQRVGGDRPHRGGQLGRLPGGGEGVDEQRRAVAQHKCDVNRQQRLTEHQHPVGDLDEPAGDGHAGPPAGWVISMNRPVVVMPPHRRVA